MDKMEKLKKHLDKFIPLYVPILMASGLLLGLPLHHIVKDHKAVFGVLNLVVVVSMIYPMMVGLNMGEMKNSFKMWKILLFGLIMGLVYPPVVMYLLSMLIPMNRYIAFGLILAVAVPCSSMSIAYTGLSKGNTELAMILVALSFILALVSVPFWLSIFGSNYHVPAPLFQILKTIIMIVVIPMTLGYATQQSIILKGGKKAFSKAKSAFPVMSLLGMYTIIFLIFTEKATMIVDKWHAIMIALIPLSLYYILTLIGMTALSLLLRIKYNDHMAVTFTSVGKNEGTAMAIALGAGIGLAAVPAAITPLIQLPFLVTYMKLHSKIEDKFRKRSFHLVEKSVED